MGHFDTVVMQPANHHFFPHNDPSTSCTFYTSHVTTVSSQQSTNEPLPSYSSSHHFVQDEVTWNTSDAGYLLRSFEQPNHTSISTFTNEVQPVVEPFSHYSGMLRLVITCSLLLTSISQSVGSDVASSMVTLMSPPEGSYQQFTGGGDETVGPNAYRPCGYEDSQYPDCYGYRTSESGQWDGYQTDPTQPKHEDRMETSGDSAFSSMASGRISSSSDVSKRLLK